MTMIALRFPGGRYHATPWGRHVNEGAIEWPPSPWRVLRALVATGFSKLVWQAVPDDACSLITHLATEPPSFRLPAGEVSHTRHYMPVIEGRKQTTTKVIDTFVRLDAGEELLIHFPSELPSDELELLESLVSSLGYFGRAESWVEGRLADDVIPDATWCVARQNGSSSLPDLGGDDVALLAPVSASEYDCWRSAASEQAKRAAFARVRAAAAAKHKQATKTQLAQAEAKIMALYPDDLLGCLLQETADLQQQGWSQPPGSQQILYRRPAGTLERRPRHQAFHPRSRPSVQAALLALTSDTKRGDVLPLFTRCLPQAELLHQSLVSLLGDEASMCSVLSGRDPTEGGRLTGHQHAHYLPLDLDEDGRLDHVIVHAPMGLDERAQAAIGRLRRTWTKGGDKDIFVTCVGMADLSQVAAQLRRRSGRSLSELSTSHRWSSITPFVPPRHLKKRNHSLEDQIRAELESRSLPPPQLIDTFSRKELIEKKLLRFVRTRRGEKPQPPAHRAFGIRLVFDESISGPITLGYASHYGLGLFAAEHGGAGSNRVR